MYKLTSILFIFAVILNSASCKNIQTRNPNGKPVQFRLVKERTDSANYKKDKSIESLEDAILISEKDIAEVYSETDHRGRPAMRLVLTNEGTNIFSDITKKNIGRIIAIVYDGQIILSPQIMTQITDGNIQVIGSFSQKEIDTMVKNIGRNE